MSQDFAIFKSLNIHYDIADVHNMPCIFFFFYHLHTAKIANNIRTKKLFILHCANSLCFEIVYLDLAYISVMAALV